MTNKRLQPRAEKGQMTIEMILIMIILTSVAITFTKAARDNAYLASMVEGPWVYLQGMIEDGVWAKAGGSKSSHPNLVDRHASHRGDPIPN